ncbi:MAG TPA: tRNA epoxyqueuosine(34) reductase QueG, partial [Ktedonobacterales bacterium]|nr:tRNA epoxyqueuosine(34) reductase QueG [Ktedonobacterales bacterium]
MSLTEQIKERAYALGFDAIRVTSAEPFPEAEAALKSRIGAGLMDGLDWFTAARAEVSANPRALAPSARSVIALATFYLTQEPSDPTQPGEPHGQVSAYAWGDDYHDVIRKRLDALAAYIRTLGESEGEEKTIVFVDTGRMVDRAVAQRSGLGWYGKNTMILTKGWGSWVFLAEIVTGLALEPDAPLGANCGQCEICLHACPSGAFVAPYVLDNRRCISYLTIELRGSIPVELRPLMGSHIFGCDICQQVCPVNVVAQARLQRRGDLPDRERRLEFQPRAPDFAAPALIPLLALDDEGFRARFQRSPIKRAKRRGLLRNVCVALGNLGDPVAVPALMETLRAEPEALVRGHAAWALGRIGGPAARAALEAAQGRESDETVLQEIRCALGMLAEMRGADE